MRNRWRIGVCGLASVLTALASLQARAAETKADWCVVRSPDSVPAGGELVLELEYFGVADKVTVYADLHYNKPDGNWAGKLARGGAHGEIQGSGTKTIRLAVPRQPTADVATVFGVVFISPKGWEERVGLVNGPPAKVLEGQGTVYPSVKLVPGYTELHPRLLPGLDDKAALREKIKARPDFWQPVLKQARDLTTYVPDSETIRKGTKYWRAEWILSAALSAFATGDKQHRDSAAAWMVAHCREDTWGVGWRENIDLFASWYLYYISLSYDLLQDQLTPAEKATIRKGLIAHARAIYEAREEGQMTYDQNHTYIPATALATAALLLVGDEPEAEQWLNYAHAVMEKCRYVLNPDGYYSEGSGYWEYAVHWHLRYADLMARATGDATLHAQPFLKNNYLYALHLSLPGAPGESAS